ncbi:MAG: hypothetical protein HFF18_09285 [Oscillospiraceae bacterium]|nr:hypothetical protein [Oscillospiraceae bacterium]
MRKKHSVAPLLRGVLLPALCIGVLLFFSTALNSLDSGHEAEDQRQLMEALRRGCVACYAAEGIYPPNLEYLEEHYGIQVDETRYTVFYSVFAANLMPDITVLVKTP